jgi:hypothetical protein
MPLDLKHLAEQISQMISHFRSNQVLKSNHLNKAIETLRNPLLDLSHLQRRIKASKTSWLLAGFYENPNQVFTPSKCPCDFSVVATDGSQVNMDRHYQPFYFIINIGAVRLDYGTESKAFLTNESYLYYRDEDFSIRQGINGFREHPIDGNLLGIKRDVEECRKIVEMVSNLSNQQPTLALFDGSLIRWNLYSQNYPDFVIEELLENGYLKYLEKLRGISSQQPLVVASYISYPRSKDVINSLRVILCPYEEVDCDKNCSKVKDGFRGCDELANINDRELFHKLLGKGERSPVFYSNSKIVRERYGKHNVHFFYLRVENEIARIEIPGWLANYNSQVNLVHTLILDQSKRGYGYPVALTEAHEQAIITTRDRELIYNFIEQNLANESIPTSKSAKSYSKRTRWL